MNRTQVLTSFGLTVRGVTEIMAGVMIKHEVMKYALLTVALPFLLFMLGSCTESGLSPVESGPGAKDAQISEMLEQISADSIEAIVRTLAGFKTRHTLSETTSDTIGIGAARRWIKKEMDRYSIQSGGRLDVKFHQFTQQPGHRVPQPAEIVNIEATLPGADSADDRMFVISGHYDSRASNIMDAESMAPGANDDASGTAAVMEIARVMSAHEFPSTIVFLLVAGEEQGMLGSAKWAGEAAAGGKQIAGMITNDIIGNPRAENGHLAAPTKVRLFARGVPPKRTMDMETIRYLQTGGENDMPTRQLARALKEASERYVNEMEVWLIYRSDRYLRGGDHLSFLSHGFPAVRFSEPHETYHHQHQNVRVENGIQHGDLPEFMDYSYVARVAQVNLAGVADLARSPMPPANVGINVSRTGNDTKLRWKGSASEQLAGYEILWRETTSPEWQHRTFVNAGTHHHTARLVSKDNWIFGIRSVSKKGHAGIPVYPMPFLE